MKLTIHFQSSAEVKNMWNTP